MMRIRTLWPCGGVRRRTDDSVFRGVACLAYKCGGDEQYPVKRNGVPKILALSKLVSPNVNDNTLFIWSKIKRLTAMDFHLIWSTIVHLQQNYKHPDSRVTHSLQATKPNAQP